jgi:hypothetical protein
MADTLLAMFYSFSLRVYDQSIIDAVSDTLTKIERQAFKKIFLI